MELLTRDSRFTVLICANESFSNCIMCWLTKILTHWWPVFSEDKIPELHWHEVKMGIQRLKEMGRLSVFIICKLHTRPPLKFLRRPERHACH